MTILRISRRCGQAASLVGLLGLLGAPLLAQAAQAAKPVVGLQISPGPAEILLAQWTHQSPPRAPRPPQSYPSSGGSNGPAPGWPTRMQDYNRAVDYWIRRSSGPMGIDPCALSELHGTRCD